MTTEMGPRDVNLGWTERLAARSIAPLIALFNRFETGTSIRFRSSTATLALSGESESSGNAFKRGILLSLLLFANMLLYFLPSMFLSETVQQAAAGGLVFWIASLLFIPTAVFGIANAFGSLTLIQKTDVVDHTTEPAPDALNELKERYVDGEIDDAELEREAAEVWER